MLSSFCHSPALLTMHQVLSLSLLIQVKAFSLLFHTHLLPVQEKQGCRVLHQFQPVYVPQEQVHLDQHIHIHRIFPVLLRLKPFLPAVLSLKQPLLLLQVLLNRLVFWLLLPVRILPFLPFVLFPLLFSAPFLLPASLPVLHSVSAQLWMLPLKLLAVVLTVLQQYQLYLLHHHLNQAHQSLNHPH